MNRYDKEQLDPHVWGPHYWFFLHTLAYSYPETPNEFTKRKYYDLVQNMPLFLPNPEISRRFAQTLDKYPVTPYLDCRESFVRWTIYIHNYVNRHLDKPEWELLDALENYLHAYENPLLLKSKEVYLSRQNVLFICVFTLGLLGLYGVFGQSQPVAKQ
jgi:hypothetical protein